VLGGRPQVRTNSASRSGEHSPAASSGCEGGDATEQHERRDTVAAGRSQPPIGVPVLPPMGYGVHDEVAAGCDDERANGAPHRCADEGAGQDVVGDEHAGNCTGLRLTSRPVVPYRGRMRKQSEKQGYGATERVVTLRDGTRALVRPILPEDRWRLAEGLKLLSPRSRYLRFHTSIEELTDEQLTYLTEIDYCNHMAWVALDPDDVEAPGLGVARYVRLADDPTVAEAAVTVIDAYQGRGLGTILLRELATTAIQNGIRTLRNYVLTDNESMIEIIDQIGAQRSEIAPGVLQVDVALPDDPARLPAPGVTALFREAARGLLQPVIWRFPWNALRRGGPGEWLHRDDDQAR
jgi:GNAT superfamily N-acetyltransferase